jgi:hypothetical protein
MISREGGQATQIELRETFCSRAPDNAGLRATRRRAEDAQALLEWRCAWYNRDWRSGGGGNGPVGGERVAQATPGGWHVRGTNWRAVHCRHWCSDCVSEILSLQCLEMLQTFSCNPLSFLIFVMATKDRSEGQMGSQAIPPRTSDDSATDTASVLSTIGNNVSTEKSVKKCEQICSGKISGAV